MNILLIEPRYYTFETTSYTGIGALYVAAAMRRAGHRVVGLHGGMEKCPDDEFVDKVCAMVAEHGVDVLSMGGLCTSFTFQRKVFKAVRERYPDLVLLTGGNLLTSEPELCMEQFGTDYGVIGEAEETLPELLGVIEQGGDPSTVDGIIFARNKGLVTTTPRPGMADLDDLPAPAYDVFYSRQELEAMPHITVFTSRSCPFNCTFCYHYKGSRYRVRSVENVMKEVRHLHETYSIPHIRLNDELFAFDQEWARDFCAAIKETGVTWNCQLRATNADEDLFRVMKDAGCTRISMGLESGSNTVLKSMRKKITRDISLKAVDMARSAGFSVNSGIIIGDFAETPETVRETIDFLKQTAIVPNGDVGFIVPYLGSPIYARCLEEGLIKDKLAFLESLSDHGRLRVNMTQMDDEQLVALQEEASTEFFKALAEERTAEVVEILSSTDTSTSMRIKCPTCGHIQENASSGYRTERIAACPECCYPVIINPLDVHHFRSKLDSFLAHVDRLKETGGKTLVTPASIFFTRLRQFVDIPDENLAGFLDNSKEKIRHPYLGKPVFERTREAIHASGADSVIICGPPYQESIWKQLKAMELDGVEIVPLLEF